MRLLFGNVLILGLQMSTAFANVRSVPNIDVAVLDTPHTIDYDKQTITLEASKSKVKCGFDRPLQCSGNKLAFNKDEKYASCCPTGWTLLGSIDTAFDCCEEGQDLVGAKETGFRCCPTGQRYDGKCCNPCSNDKVLEEGICRCQAGSIDTASRGCELCINGKVPDADKKTCVCGVGAIENGGRCMCAMYGWESSIRDRVCLPGREH
jgi:hypothetical protein